jgi:hypothetical protein
MGSDSFPRFADALRLNQVSLCKRLLISAVMGLAALIAVLGLSQIEAVAPGVVVLLLPGDFVAAKIGGAPCSTSHVLDCPFWDVDYKALNTPILTFLWLVLDWILYASLFYVLWRWRRRHANARR